MLMVRKRMLLLKTVESWSEVVSGPESQPEIGNTLLL
jgi:hypothetical protein